VDDSVREKTADRAMALLRERTGSMNDQELRERIAMIPRRRRLGMLRNAAARDSKDQAKATARAAPPPAGYCCPKCHTWHPTPEARKACRISHRPEEVLP
jgi:hypothetical protein